MLETVCYKNEELRPDRVHIMGNFGCGERVMAEAVLGEYDDIIQVVCRKKCFPQIIVNTGNETKTAIYDNVIIMLKNLQDSEFVVSRDSYYGKSYSFMGGYPRVEFDAFGYQFLMTPFEGAPGRYQVRMITPSGDSWVAFYSEQ